MLATAIPLVLAACGGSTERVGSIPPCNAWIFLWGAADLTLDCHSQGGIPVVSTTRKVNHTTTTTNPPKK